jgi:coenzyme F420-reducing hydrogenase delta subunit
MGENKSLVTEEQSDYMKFIMNFHNTMVERRLTLVYEGEVTQDITKAFTAMTEKNLDKIDEDGRIKKKVYHVMVECLQNIAKHADDETDTASDKLSDGLSKSGIFVVGSDDSEYFITSGNNILNENISMLKDLINNVNSLDKEGLKELYKFKMKENAISDKGGAGLGFIDIVRKTGNPLQYYFEPIDDKSSFFILKSRINRNVVDE